MKIQKTITIDENLLEKATPVLKRTGSKFSSVVEVLMADFIAKQEELQNGKRR